MKSSNSCCLSIVGIFSMLAIGIMLLLARCTYTSPINEAGREYKKNITAYENSDIQTIEDVHARLEVLDTHFNSQTFDKMQGGKKVEVQLSDIETLFGTPDNVIENVDMYFIDAVYQYSYENQTISFHDVRGNIDEYILEDYLSTLYTPEHLDQLFIDAILNHQIKIKHVDDKFELIPLEQASKSIVNEFPTRELKQNGWHGWYDSPIQYYDDGSGEYAPEEYLLLNYRKDNDVAFLHTMERRYKETYLHLDSIEDAERKREAYYDFQDRIDEENEKNGMDDRITVGDFSNAFGDMSKIQYNFRNGMLRIKWLSLHETNREFSTEILLENITSLEKLNDLEVNHLEMNTIDLSSERQANDFISSK